MSEYSAAPSGGKLRLKGVQDSRVDKKKKKKRKLHQRDADIDANVNANDEVEDENATIILNQGQSHGGDDGEDGGDRDRVTDNSVVLKSLLRDEDNRIEKESRRKMGVVDGKQIEPGAGAESEAVGLRLKTEAERRYDEQRRRRLEERLKREGVKTHKERVQELNRYLSTLSEHHDMPKIGPG